MTSRKAHRSLATAAGLALALAASALADEKLDTLKAKTDRWIEVQQRLATERSQWLGDKALLANTVAALEASRDSLSQRIELLELERLKSSDARAAAEAQLEDHQAGEAALEQRLAAFERRAEALGESLPDPLKEKLGPALQKLRADGRGDRFGASARIQNLLAILAQVDEFNNSIAYSHVIRETEGGETIDVRVMYWGLAFAYAINGDGTRAWMVQPGPDGWQWSAQDKSAPALAALFEVYEKTATPELVSAPASVANRLEAAP